MRKQGYTKAETAKRTLFTLCCTAAVVMAAALIGFVAYTLALRTQYKKTALEINEAFRTTPPEAVTVSQGDAEFPANVQVTEYYNQFLLNGKTVVFNRKKTEPDDKTITLTFRDSTFSLTGLEDGSAVAICWKTPETEENYTVRAQMTFLQLDSYFQNYKRKMQKQSGG